MGTGYNDFPGEVGMQIGLLKVLRSGMNCPNKARCVTFVFPYAPFFEILLIVQSLKSAMVEEAI